MSEARSAPVRDRLVVTSPGVGADWSRVNDKGELWLIRAITFQLVTAAAVATRVVGLTVAADQDIWFRTAPATGQVAALTRKYAAFPGAPAGGDSTAVILAPLPNNGLWVPRGHTIASVTDQIQAADQYSAIIMDIYRFTPTSPRWLEPMVELLQRDEQAA